MDGYCKATFGDLKKGDRVLTVQRITRDEQMIMDLTAQKIRATATTEDVGIKTGHMMSALQTVPYIRSI